MTSKTCEHTLCSLSFTTLKDYETNLLTLIDLIEKSPKHSIIVAPEVCLTGFDYENFEEVTKFASHANKSLKQVTKDKTLILTIIEKRAEEVFNFVKVFHNSEIVYERSKAKLFRFGGEEKYFTEGKEEEVAIIEIDGIKVGLLVCFELRFKDLWKKLEGSDVIAVPSWWGVLRKKHFEVLSEALAVMNQCYVVASDSYNDECTKLSGIITPQGRVFRNGNKACLEYKYNKKEIAIMRRYMDVGIG